MTDQKEDQGVDADKVPEKSRFLNRIVKRIRRGRRSIEKHIEARAIKLGIEPKPLIKGIWELLLLLPRLVKLTFKLLIDKRIPVRLRLLCGLAIAYAVSPIDILPEGIIGPIGYLDDLAVLITALDILLNEVDPKIVAEHWSGEEDVLTIVQESVDIAKLFIPKAFDKALRKFMKKTPVGEANP